MPKPYFNGKPLDPLELESDIFSLLRKLRGKVKDLIPLGGGIVFKLLNNKIFNLRPQVLNSTYSSITKNNTKETEIPVQWLGTPLTLSLLEQLKVAHKYDETLEPNAGKDFSQFYSYSETSNEYKVEDVFPLNPSSDRVFDSMPMKGNSPFIFNGYFGFSNFVQDSNIRLYTNETGSSLSVKAKRVSLLLPSQTTTGNIVQNDSLIGEPDRKEIDAIHLDDINISITNNTLFDESASIPGHFPILNKGKDLGVWLVHDNTTNKTSAILTDWTNDYVTLNGVVKYPHPTWLSGATANYIYFRCIGCVFVDSDGYFQTSKTLAWGEIATTLNGDPAYTETYQQNPEANFTFKNSTSPDDRRIIPSFYYLYQKNPSLQSLVNYKGLIRSAPGAGASDIEISLDSPVQNSNPACFIKANSLELTNGNESFWLSNLNISIPSFNPSTNSNQTFIDTGTFTYGESYYVWLVADPYCLLDPSNNAPKNNLKIKILLSKSDTWKNINSTWKTNNPRYVLRNRICWIKTIAATNEVQPFYMKDGTYYYLNLPGASNVSAGAVYEFSDNATLINGTSSQTTWQELTPTNLLPTDITNSYILAKSISGRLAIVTGSASTVENYLGISCPDYGATINTTPDWANPYSFAANGMPSTLQSYKSGTSMKTSIQNKYELFLNKDSQILYAADLGADSGTSGTKWFVTVDEMYLPVNGDFCYL